jgi:hypothetical protein
MSGIDRSGGELLVHVVSDGQVGEAMIEGVTGHQCVGCHRLINSSDTEDLPAPGGPVTTTSSPIAALSVRDVLVT